MLPDGSTALPSRHCPRCDADNDGDLDIYVYVANGHVIDNVHLYHQSFTYAQKELLYENLGRRAANQILVIEEP